MKLEKTDIIKNPLKILYKKEVLSALKKHWINNHENLIDPEKFVEEFFAYLLKAGKHENADRAEVRKSYNAKLKSYWKGGGDSIKPKDMFLEMMEKELDRVKIALDFGCGKLAFLKELAENNKKIKKMIGIDPISQPVLGDLDARIDFQRSLVAIKKESVDLAIIKLVLHHLRRSEEVREILQKIGSVLRPKGRLVIFEESFPEHDYKSNETIDYLEKIGLKPSEATEEFMSLVKEDKVKFLFLNDWIMNVQNNYMPWTGLYKSMEQWRELAESVGFKEKESHFVGAIKHRKRKQGMTVYMVFEK
ncbi:MAG: hypothetical protein ACD_15C00225G0008 [uncultured bacterium]|nr:MAG: hypothetical protein ACD_15C00225G0008 [uncultured bacterium]HCU70125.1 hypothetical protein [Candidatus Moranbacteria bacterium]